MNLKTPLYLLMLALAISVLNACSEENLSEELFDDQIDTSGDNPEDSDSDDSDDSDDTESTNCTPANYVFEEAEGIVLGEFEASAYSGDWEKSGSGSSSYLSWGGSQFFSEPGQGIIRFKINISTAGSYRFSWHSAVTIGSNGTEHNDSWLRFPDASDFYAVKGDSFIYPVGSGKTPNPNGSSSDGWFKVYRTGSGTDFNWQSFTSDHDAHTIHVDFDSPGVYTMEVSARSSGHGIDKFILARTDVDFDKALGSDTSARSCSN